MHAGSIAEEEKVVVHFIHEPDADLFVKRPADLPDNAFWCACLPAASVVSSDLIWSYLIARAVLMPLLCWQLLRVCMPASRSNVT